MAMDSVQQLERSAPPEVGVFARLARSAQQFICGLHGHDALLHFEEGRMSLECSSCGYESPGWDVKPAQAPREVTESAPRVVRMPLVRARRAA